jgi:hypothetical protein
LTGSVLQTGDDGEAEIETIVTGETILMTGLEGAARTLLTLGPVAGVMATLESFQADPSLSKPRKSVPTLPLKVIYLLKYPHSQRNHLHHLHRLKRRKKPSA